ncbi:MAG: PHP domain-containing protein [Planctomycetota bacterium]
MAAPILHDFHMHTIYSRHSSMEMTVPTILHQARDLGLRKIVILEHVPEISTRRKEIPEWYKGRNDRSCLDSIAADLAPLQGELRDLRVYRGVELDADPFTLDGSVLLDDLSGIDVVVLSTHVFPGGDAFWYDPVALPPFAAERVAERWFRWLLRCVESAPANILAHPGDLIMARELVPAIQAPKVLAAWEPILKTMARRGIAFELNELLATKIKPTYRDKYPALVEFARRCGCKFSVGSDAHQPAKIGRYKWVPWLIDAAHLTPDDMFDLP